MGKKIKETQEYTDQAEQAAKAQGESEEILVYKQPVPKVEEPTLTEQVVAMTDLEYRVLIIEMLSEIVTRLRQKDAEVHE